MCLAAIKKGERAAEERRRTMRMDVFGNNYTDEQIEEQAALSKQTTIDVEMLLIKEAIDLNERVLSPLLDGKKINNKSYFFISVRPKNDDDFWAFKKQCDKFASSKQITEAAWSFEQKGESIDTLGTGYHLHIVAKWNLYKSQVIQQAVSAFKNFAEPQCVDVKVCGNPMEHVQRYLVDYDCDDDHKSCTKEWDARWRTSLGLDALYTRNWGGLSSPVTPPIPSSPRESE